MVFKKRERVRGKFKLQDESKNCANANIGKHEVLVRMVNPSLKTPPSLHPSTHYYGKRKYYEMVTFQNRVLYLRFFLLFSFQTINYMEQMLNINTS